jgi:hypothetical protein
MTIPQIPAPQLAEAFDSVVSATGVTRRFGHGETAVHALRGVAHTDKACGYRFQ